MHQETGSLMFRVILPSSHYKKQLHSLKSPDGNLSILRSSFWGFDDDFFLIQSLHIKFIICEHLTPDPGQRYFGVLLTPVWKHDKATKCISKIIQVCQNLKNPFSSGGPQWPTESQRHRFLLRCWRFIHLVLCQVCLRCPAVNTLSICLLFFCFSDTIHG